MAKFKRTYHEALIQKVLSRSLSGSGFQRTSNARNEVMFQEATQFSQWLTVVQKDILTTQKAVNRFMKGTSDLMQSTLPCTFEESTPGVLTTLELERKTVGDGINLQKLQNAPIEAKNKMDSNVLQPLNNWMAGYKQIKIRMNEVEKLRLEVDSRRRTVVGMSQHLNRSKTKHFKKEGSSPSDSAMEDKLQRMESRVEHKSVKAETALSQYNELEIDTFNQLCDLIKDTVFLKSYMAEAMLIYADCFSAAYAAFSGRTPLSEKPHATQVTSGSETSTQVQESNPFGSGAADDDDDTSNPFGGEKANPFSNKATTPLYPKVDDTPVHIPPSQVNDSASSNPFDS
eukprot:TRINITY_DN9950_c0_g1_i1.p2 TRINITY_DN9950_c0_g1~~TRINITY_DN9950_c0_g1_i1.p2  ORF type:complete len:343 (-),score=55.89 TRINITY_DN9950_c0_g1_i1:1116-2144(-)